MSKESFLRVLIWLVVIGSLCCSSPPPRETGLHSEKGQNTLLLFDFETPIAEERIETSNVQAEPAVTGSQNVLRILSSPSLKDQYVLLRPPGNHWNLSRFKYLSVSVSNKGTRALNLVCQVENPHKGAFGNYNAREITIHPGGTRFLKVTFIRILPTGRLLFGMKGYPGALVQRNGLRPEIVHQLRFTIGNTNVPHEFELDDILAGGSYSYPDWIFAEDQEFFPCIDRFGQYVHSDWPNKIRNDRDFLLQIEKEREDLLNYPGPENWNQYGGWQDGPTFETRPGFYPAKHQGKWWLVDPSGHLFWLHGINCVRSNNGTTPISDREHWFESLPESSENFSQFLVSGERARRGYYSGKLFKTYSFSQANLLRKYGDDWERHFSDLAHKRLRSWGLNTIGNWSDEAICLERRTPYVTSIFFSRRTLGGGQHFPDPFDPEFKSSLIERLKQEKGKTAEDPFCIGYFVDNELRWMSNASPAIYTLQSDANQPAKRKFVQDLRRSYSNIHQLNHSWGTQYTSWEDLAASTSLPNLGGGCSKDLVRFSEELAETYFRTVREAIKLVTPHRLYLGCRFGQFAAAEIAVSAAAEYCDVISFNLYKPWKRSAMRLALPAGIDRPIVIGEFHFGALDRGPLATGLAPVENQAERAASYKRYVKGALEDSSVIGTNWFQYSDQATTGRNDGENYQIGFVDICDTPYKETVEAAREIGSTLYSYRLSDDR